MVKHSPKPDPYLRAKLRAAARQMRHEATPAEDRLWQQLRARQLCGYRFRRQHRIDRFIVDFACLQPALVIEVDGEVHRQQTEADQEREEILHQLGFRVVRFSNAQVLQQTERVLQELLSTLEGIPSPVSRSSETGEGHEG